jgi:hypothetical protein
MCRYSFCGTKWDNDEPV